MYKMRNLYYEFAAESVEVRTFYAHIRGCSLRRRLHGKFRLHRDTYTAAVLTFDIVSCLMFSVDEGNYTPSQ